MNSDRFNTVVSVDLKLVYCIPFNWKNNIKSVLCYLVVGGGKYVFEEHFRGKIQNNTSLFQTSNYVKTG